MKKAGKKIVGIVFVIPFMAAALFCCCLSGEASAKNIISQQKDFRSEVHACCDGVASQQSNQNSHKSNECQCEFSAIENTDIDDQVLSYNFLHIFSVNQGFSDFHAVGSLQSLKTALSETADSSPPIYIRLAHLLI